MSEIVRRSIGNQEYRPGQISPRLKYISDSALLRGDQCTGDDSNPFGFPDGFEYII
jgi:hypothetical protein